MNNLTLPSDALALLTELLRKTIGNNVYLASYEILNQHADYYVLQISLKKPALQLAVKLAGPDAPYHYPFDRTAMFHRVVREQTSIAMPEILAVDASYANYPWRYLIKTYLPGEECRVVKPQLITQDQVDAYQQIGQAVAELHNIRFEAFGEVNSDGMVKSGSDYPSALNHHILKIIKNPDHRDMLLRLVDKQSSLFQDVTEARLCHEDLHHRNILFTHQNGRWQLATILDFDKAWAGHHEIDLAKLEFWTDMMGEGFWQAYNQVISLDARYPERRPIYQLLWCLDYADNTPKHLADTRLLCQQLGLPIIKQFM